MKEETNGEAEKRKARVKELIDKGVLGNNTNELVLVVKNRR
ncbi:unnamed protein product [marine sediment metagenome]|uniref:Uncharacterized protein n=1 Tax=marine sediment metagenome TaxID=412755 RepID=X1EEY9_9ZZZZ